MPDGSHGEINRIRAMVDSGLRQCSEAELERFVDVLNRYDAALHPEMTLGLRQPVQDELARKQTERRHKENLEETRKRFDVQQKVAKEAETQPPDSGRKLPRRTLTVMFTDMAGYSTLMGQNEAAALEILKDHNAVVIPCISDYYGTLIKATGDGYMICFEAAVDALQCAFAVQDAVSKLRIGGNPIKIRIGINTGDVFVDKNDLFGEVVNNAKRIEAEACSGGICISDSVRQSISGSERKLFSFEGGVELSLKGASERVKCWHVTWADSTHSSPLTNQPFVRQPAAKIPAVFFNDVSDLIGDRPGPYKISDAAKLYLRLSPTFAVPPINTELEAKNYLVQGQVKPLGRATSWGPDRNAFGAITLDTAHDGTIQYFTQLFLSRELWGVDCVILNEDRIRKQLEQWGFNHLPSKYIATGYVEQHLVKCLEEYLAFAFAHLKLPLPLNIEVGLVGIKGYSLAMSDDRVGGNALRDIFGWSDQILSYEKPPWEILEPCFNKIWDNCGLVRSPQTQAHLARLFQTKSKR